MGFRDVKDAARRDLHAEMQVPAFYIPDASEPLTYTEIGARVHNKHVMLGDVQGVSFNYAERIENVTAVIFLRDEVPEPERGALVIISPEEGYRLDRRDPYDGSFVRCPATQLSAAEMVGLPSPGG